MATEAGELLVKISADISDIKSNLATMGSTVKSVGADTIASGNLIADGIEKMGAMIVSVAQESVMAFATQEQAIVRLTAAVGTDASAALVKYANALQQTTTYSDDAIIATETQLANFGLLPGSIKQATDAITNFAARTGKDLPEATNTFTQALGGNARQLKQMGLVLTDTDDRGSRMAKTIAFMNDNFAGTAAEIKGTTLGSFASLQNEISDLEKHIGQILSPAIKTLVGWLEKAVSMLDSLTGSTYKNADANNQQIMTLQSQNKLIAQALQGHTEYKNTLMQELGVQAISDDAMRKRLITNTDEINLLKKKEAQIKTTAAADATGIKQTETLAQLAVDKRVNGMILEMQTDDEVETNMQTISTMTTLLKIKNSQLELAQLTADQVSISQMTNLETQKRLVQSQQSWEANASFSDQFKVKLADDMNSNTAAWANMATGFIDSFAQATAKMIVEGGRFRDVIKSLWQNIAEQVIAQIEKMIAEWLLWMAITGGGGGFGGFLGYGAGGGMINEPSMIIGMRSGTSMIAGEAGPEAFGPAGTTNTLNGAGSAASSGGDNTGGGGGLTINISGQFLEGSASKWQNFVKQQIVPQVRRWTMSSPSGPFNRKRGAS